MTDIFKAENHEIANPCKGSSYCISRIGKLKCALLDNLESGTTSCEEWVGRFYQLKLFAMWKKEDAEYW